MKWEYDSDEDGETDPDADLFTKLWKAADELRANSNLKATEYVFPILGLVYIMFFGRQNRKESALFGEQWMELIDWIGTHQDDLSDLGNKVNKTMQVLQELDDGDMAVVLPSNYDQIEGKHLANLIKLFEEVSSEIGGDIFGRIYEFFLLKFAQLEGRGGGVYYTPTSVVKLIVEILDPSQGMIFDPACGSGGMFVQSAKLCNMRAKNGGSGMEIFGMEKSASTANIARMNLRVNGLKGDIKQCNSYYEDPFDSPGKFDYVIANPPFNVNKVDKERLETIDEEQKEKGDLPRYPLGMPKPDNGNYLWIQMFLGALKEKGRAGFVMANASSDARHSEMELRKKMIEQQVVDVMISVNTNFFFSVTLPFTLWFLDKGKGNTERADDILFINAKGIFRQIDRAHRDFHEEQYKFIANIVRLYRGNDLGEMGDEGGKLFEEMFPDRDYVDVTGLCKVATKDEISREDWSLNPGRYVGVTRKIDSDFDFIQRLKELHGNLVDLHNEAVEIEGNIISSMSKFIDDGG